MVIKRLPERYQDLEPYLEWALPTMKERLERRLAVDYNQALAFYQSMFPRVEEVIQYLNRTKLSELPEEDIHLFHMLLSIVEISTSIEIYKQMTVPLGVPHERFPMWNAVSDNW